jgi:hypothetical protein
MSHPDSGVRVTAPAGVPPQTDWRRSAALAAVIGVLLAGVVFPLRRYAVEPAREELLGRHESPGRRLALASQFGFDTAAGAGLRLVPGRPVLELSDLPSEAVTVILGGFRGPYIVWLWIKAEEEKQQKVHFDLLDRYAKIAALQSDYPQVWTYMFWNIVWNVTVQWQSPERKYEWIRRGIEFLREGYRKNPHSALIMESMGRVYSEKLGRSQEAPYYRQRVKEDEGRSAFLIAYEWYDRMRRANDRYGTLTHTLGKPVAYSQACHSLSFYSQELTQDAYDALKSALDARQAGRDAEGRRTFQEGSQKLADAIAAWEWARREWRDQALRFEKEDVSPELIAVYRKFYNEADGMVKELQAARTGLTYENLPERFKQMHRPELK